MITCIFESGQKASLRHVTVDILVHKGNEVLLVKRRADFVEGGKWGLTGGFVGRNETAEQAAKREVREETGFEIRIEKRLRIKDDPKRPGEDRQNISFVYTAQALELVSEPDNESSEIRWFGMNNLPPKKQIAFDHYDDIKLFMEDIKDQTQNHGQNY